jgi:hypothetical protein
MSDETRHTPDEAEGSVSGAQPEHYWSMEHHSYREQARVQPAPASPSPRATQATRGRRNRLVAAGVLAATLVAGAGSVAVAQAADHPDQAQQVQVGPVGPVGPAGHLDHRGDHGQGERLGPGR